MVDNDCLIVVGEDGNCSNEKVIRNNDYMWVAARVRSFSQQRVIKRYYNDFSKLINLVNYFYVPEIEKDGYTKIVIPFVLFANVKCLDLLPLWKKLDGDIFGFYRNSRGKTYVFSNYEIEELIASIKQNSDKLLKVDKINVGDVVYIHSGPFFGFRGVVLSIKDHCCLVSIMSGMIFAKLYISYDCLMKVESKLTRCSNRNVS